MVERKAVAADDVPAFDWLRQKLGQVFRTCNCVRGGRAHMPMNHLMCFIFICVSMSYACFSYNEVNVSCAVKRITRQSVVEVCVCLCGCAVRACLCV